MKSGILYPSGIYLLCFTLFHLISSSYDCVPSGLPIQSTRYRASESDTIEFEDLVTAESRTVSTVQLRFICNHC